MSSARLHPHDTEVTLVTYDLHPRTAEVVGTTDLTPNLRRVRFRCTDPESFHFVPMAPDEHVKLFFPQPDTGEIRMPELGPRGIVAPTDGPRPIHRDYTVRAFDADHALIDIDFVLHTHGVGGSWAAAAQPGDRLGMLGPRGSHVYPTGYDWYLLAADETALPALSRWLDELPAGKRVAAFIEVADAAAELALADRAGTAIRYVHRGDTPPGGSDLLERAIREYAFPPGDFFAWIAGEATTLTPIRRYLRREVGLPKDRMKVDGYWRAGTINLDHHDPGGDED
ncbi:siderophore-interacting protein [Gordonia sp. CPCC 205515]|uniref:siderophore-interacting protein n=1 Tax=Gordonia sp. CPCC 205515 TaxID=3140791 RepID=UPI003AF3BC21